MTSKSIHLKIVSHPENLKKIREVITDTAQNLNFSEKEVSSIILAVDEVCSNIIRHGYNNDYTRQIHLTITQTAQQLTIDIEDEGISFDITAAEPRDIHDIKPGGLGVYIIKEVMDKVEYHTIDDGLNHMTLIKKLKP